MINNKKTDLRIIKTEQAIENAFVELIQEKGYINVKIIDIAAKANVNRNTIYERYGSKEEIIVRLFTKTFNTKFELMDIEELLKLRNNRRKIKIMFERLFKLLDEDLDLYRTLLMDYNLSGYVEKLVSVVRNLMKSVVKKTEKNEIIVEYIVKGVFGVIQKWIIYDFGTIEENVNVLTQLCVSCVRHLQLI